jgi:cell division septation protein DedD
LVGAIIILSVAFYMAREKSYLPPDEITIEEQDNFEEETVQKSEADQETIDEFLSQSTAAHVGSDDQVTLKQPEGSLSQEQGRDAEEEVPAQSTEQSFEGESEIIEEQVDAEEKEPEQTYSEETESNKSTMVHTVQVGYFSVENNARGLAEEIENYGFQTYVVRHDGAYKVQVGAYQQEEQAEEAAQELKNLGYEIWVTQR